MSNKRFLHCHLADKAGDIDNEACPTSICSSITRGMCQKQEPLAFSFLKFIVCFTFRLSVIGIWKILYAADINKFCCQVIATRTKIYIILEFITGGELFDKIVSRTLKWTKEILQIILLKHIFFFD